MYVQLFCFIKSLAANLFLINAFLYKLKVADQFRQQLNDQGSTGLHPDRETERMTRHLLDDFEIKTSSDCPASRHLSCFYLVGHCLPVANVSAHLAPADFFCYEVREREVAN